MNFPISSKLVFKDGRAHIMVNGVSIPPVIYGLSDIPASRSTTEQARRNIANFANAGVNLVQVDTDMRHCWLPGNKVDTSSFRREIAGAIEANPDALVIVRLHLNPPVWWMDEHPEEMNLFAEGSGEAEGVVDRQISRDLELVRRVSLASRVWLDDGAKVLAAIINNVKDTEEGGHVVGIQVACGVYGEWHQWGFLKYNPDYSRPMTMRFRKFLKDKYGDDNVLRTAWNNPDVTIETAEIPSVERREKGDDGIFRHPRRSADVIDSLKCLMTTVPEAILHFAKVVKENWGRNILVGTFYGYFFNVGVRAAVGGHLEPQMLLDSSCIDYLSGPFSYNKDNRALDGPGHSRALMESIRLHKKLWLTEMDQAPIGTADFPGRGDPAHLNESIAIMKRNMMESLRRGMGAWYYDHRIVPNGSLYEKTGWWEAPELMATVAELQHEAALLDKEPYMPKAKIALVYDTEMFYHIACGRDNLRFSDPEIFQPVLTLHRLGVLFDSVNLQDFDLVEWERYKVVVFVATPLITCELRTKIDQRLKNGGRHLVWCYASGYSNGMNLDIENIRSITGLPVERMGDEDREYGRGPVFSSEVVERAFAGWTSHYFPNCHFSTEDINQII